MAGLDKEELERRSEVVASEYDGMVPYCEVFYLRSIMYSASRAHDAFKRYDVARSQDDSPNDQVSAVHEALGHAAALSRFFWPSGLGKKEYVALRNARADKLRKEFVIEDDSPLKDRKLRDSLEHFDERLDLYLLEFDTGIFLPDAIIGSAGTTDDPVGSIFKLVDPQMEIFVVLGEKYAFGAIRKAVSDILESSTKRSRSGGRL